MSRLTIVILSALLIVGTMYAAPSPVGAQGIEDCDIIYHDMTHYIALPLGCVPHSSTPTAPLRDAPDGYTPLPIVLSGEGEATAPECYVPDGPTIKLEDAHTIYYAPDARAVTPWVIPAGSTARLAEADGDWLRIGWACDTVWVNMG